MTDYSMPSGRYEQCGDYIVRPRGKYGWNLARLAVLVAVLTSAPWIWMLYGEREQNAQLLADAMVSPARIERLTLKYSNGKSTTVDIRERE